MAIKVLVFESDPAFAETLRTGLLKLGCEVSLVDDANNGLAAASRDKPDLILLAIELPRMNGFSVCNKLKRDPALKDVPLIIMSSDSSEETFEQHRRLRTRAEDYVHKPISFDDLMARASTYVSFGQEPAKPDEPPAVAEDDVVIDDDIEIEEDELGENTEREPALDGATAREADDGVATTTRESMVDDDVADFAEQAFGNLLDESAATKSARPPAVVSVPAPAPPSEAPLSLGSAEVAIDDAEVAIDDAEVAMGDAEIAVSEPPAAAPLTSERPPEPSFSAPPPSASAESAENTDDIEVDEVEIGDPSLPPPPPVASEPPRLQTPLPVPSPLPARLPSIRASSLPPRAAEVGDVVKYREELEKSRLRVKELEDEVRRTKDRADELEEVSKRGAGKDVEVQRLQRELTDVQAKLASSGKGAGSAREFLDLREQLNKKDKEILDFKDQLSHKEKELLGLRDSAIVGQQDLGGGIVAPGMNVTDAYAAALGTIGIRVQGGAAAAEQSAAIAADATTAVSEKSGVNLDEEAARLIQFQQSYQAAAKMLQIAQSLFDNLLTLGN